MAICTKKYFGLLFLIPLLAGFTQIKAQPTINPASIRCVSIDAAGDATLTWVLPSNMNNSFQSFWVWASTNFGSGYSVVATITNPGQTFTTIPVGSLPVSPNSKPVYFYMSTNTSVRDSNSDTVSSIYLFVTNPGNGTAQLNWNAISNPLPPGSSTWYQIYREADSDNVWTWVDSTKNLSYIDTITYCSAYLDYQVQIADSTICTSTSNVAGSTSPFSCQIAPPQAVMDTVSVTSSNTVDISWARSTKNNIIGYIIYEYNGYVWVPIDTVYGINNISLLNYTKGGNPSDSALSFEVAALDSCKHVGAISPSQTSLFLKESPDLCAHKNTLTWNGYVNLVGSVGGYRLYVSVNGNPYSLLGTTAANVTSYIDSNLYTVETRCYYVQVYDSAHNDTSASSNRVCFNVFEPRQPTNDYLRTATVLFNTSSINVEGYVDTLSGAGYYAFQRSSDSLGDYTTINTIPAAHHGTDDINYIDNAENPGLQSFRYRIVTLDSCSYGMDTSNLGRTMYLTAVGQPTKANYLQWNDYSNWYDGPGYYNIYRSEDLINWSVVDIYNYNPGNGGYNSYSDDISQVTLGQGTFYYYIQAIEANGSKYPFIDTSLSNIAEAYQDPVVYIPDAFDPYGVNKVFIPKGVFIDATGYDFIILNRWGEKIFESTDPTIGWDGRVNNGSGKPVEEDVYVYLLTYTSSRGEYFQRKGTVTLLK